MQPVSPPPTSAAPAAWHRRSAEEILSQLDSRPTGLSAVEAAGRLARDGANTLQESARAGPLRILAAQFHSLIIWILLAAGLVSGLLGETVDAIAIFAIVVLNAAIGFHEEFKAEQSIAALRKLTAAQATVRRDGEATVVPAAAIVVGDILVLAAGDLVAADARLVSASSLRCIEAALTGEAQAASKHADTLDADEVPLGDRANLVFMGTGVAAGAGQAVVVATAMRTELGRIASLITEAGADVKTPLQRKLDGVGRILVWAALGVVALLFCLGLWRGTPLLELFLTSISLAVAAVPEGLPAVVTVALSLGVVRMARRHVLVRKLAAVETLGSTGIICTDKTGTLTVGEMTVRALHVAGKNYTVTGEGYGPEGEVLFEGGAPAEADRAALRELASVLLACTQARLVREDGDGQWKVIGDPTEGALLAAGAKAARGLENIEHEWPRQGEFPFDSDRKRASVIRRLPDGKLRVFVNGAPGLLLERCTQLRTATGVRALTDEDRKRLLTEVSALADQALRVLGSAYRDLLNPSATGFTVEVVERELVFVGLAGMYDPPRPEAREAIAKCHAAGIRVVMITGDHPRTATAIAEELGIAPANGAVALTGVELDTLSEEALLARAAEVAVYARVTAAHKLRIVRALKADGTVVAMTGDGVNDAPAIQGADIGIAMGRTGTEVTKQTADMILADDRFATIVAAVEEGRGIYDNIRKTLQYLLAGNTGELLLMLVCVASGLPAPLLPIHLLWINLVTDGLPALCLATDPIDPDVMARGPRARAERITDRRFLRTMAFTGVLTAGVTLLVYLHALHIGTTETARTAAFTVLVFSELFRAFGARSETKPVWHIPLSTNRPLVGVVLVSIGLQIWSQHNAFFGGFLKSGAMSLPQCLGYLAVATVPLLGLEVLKLARRQAEGTVTAQP